MTGACRLGTLVVAAALAAAGCDDDTDAASRGAAAQAGTGGNSSTIGVGGSADCTRAEDANSAVVRPLEDRCSKFACPATVAEAAEQALGSCNNTFPPR